MACSIKCQRSDKNRKLIDRRATETRFMGSAKVNCQSRSTPRSSSAQLLRIGEGSYCGYTSERQRPLWKIVLYAINNFTTIFGHRGLEPRGSKAFINSHDLFQSINRNLYNAPSQSIPRVPALCPLWFSESSPSIVNGLNSLVLLGRIGYSSSLITEQRALTCHTF